MADNYKCIVFSVYEPPRIVKGDPMQLVGKDVTVEMIRLTPSLALLVDEDARLLNPVGITDVSVILTMPTHSPTPPPPILIYKQCVVTRVRGARWGNLTDEDINTLPTLRLITPMHWRAGWV